MKQKLEWAFIAAVVLIVAAVGLYPTITGNPITYEQYELQEYKRQTAVLERLALAMERIAAAMEVKAEVILKATKVDGIYSADPFVDPEATKYDRISYLQVLERRLTVMDATAISLCMDNRLPIVVFNLRTPGNLKRAIMGEAIGSTVTA